ncbi:MAG: hypothetical protein KI793_06585 [Rivularia sp. (in: Bacteria)]|nr:hypothetical protein [Rivularia sp. MS3]
MKLHNKTLASAVFATSLTLIGLSAIPSFAHTTQKTSTAVAQKTEMNPQQMRQKHQQMMQRMKKMTPQQMRQHHQQMMQRMNQQMGKNSQMKGDSMNHKM